MNGRQRSRLRRAQELGYLDASTVDNTELLQAFGLWCWRLRIPMVWVERRSDCSRYRRVQLEMFTSANRLTEDGEDRMLAICVPGNEAKWTAVSAHVASWDHVAKANAVELARAVFKAAVRPENYERTDAVADWQPARHSTHVLHRISA